MNLFTSFYYPHFKIQHKSKGDKIDSKQDFYGKLWHIPKAIFGVIALQKYDFDIKYRRSIMSKVANALSRQPIPDIENALAKAVTVIEDIVCPWYRRNIPRWKKIRKNLQITVFAI